MQAGRIVARAPANPTHLWCPRIPLPHAPPASTCAPPLLPAPGLGSSLGQFMQPPLSVLALPSAAAPPPAASRTWLRQLRGPVHAAPLRQRDEQSVRKALHWGRGGGWGGRMAPFLGVRGRQYDVQQCVFISQHVTAGEVRGGQFKYPPSHDLVPLFLSIIFQCSPPCHIPWC